MSKPDRSATLRDIAAALDILARAAEAEGEMMLAYLIGAARTEAEFRGGSNAEDHHPNTSSQ